MREGESELVSVCLQETERDGERAGGEDAVAIRVWKEEEEGEEVRRTATDVYLKAKAMICP